jgi:hypothetical protein
MYRTIVTSAAVVVAALAIVAGASAVTMPAVCVHAVPNPYIPPTACAAAETSTPPLSPAVLRAISDANHRVSESLPQTASDALDPAIATAVAAQQPPAAASSASGPGFDWGSAGIGAAVGALLLTAAVGSGGLLRRRRSLLHA